MQAPLSCTASGDVVHFDLAPSLVSFHNVPPPLSVGAWGMDQLPHLASLTADAAQSVLPGLGSPSARRSAVAEGAGLAHDAGNLLGALQLYSDLLARPGVLRAEHRHYAEELRLLGGRSEALIDRLLRPACGDALSHTPATTNSAPLREDIAVIPEVLDRCFGLLNTISQRAVKVVVDPDTSIPVAASAEILERVLVNLTKNAAEASAPGSSITLRVQASPGCSVDGRPKRILLSVEDQGCGLSHAAAHVLLGDYPSATFRAGRARGLGLRVVRELVAAAGAELRLSTEAGRGTCIEIGWRTAESGLPTAHESNALWPPQGAPAIAEGTTGRLTC